MKLIESPSPNFDERGRAVDTVILHYTGMKTGAAALARLCDPKAKVSAHYFVEEDGAVYQLVEEQCRAWHAGVSSWRGEGEINARSIGIEIVNPGHEWGYRDFPAPQIEAVIKVLKAIRTRHDVAVARVLAHSDIAPARKEDPGEKFPWLTLASAGVAIGPYVGGPDIKIPYEEAFAALRAIGYEVPDIQPGVKAPAAAVLAFQRRFCTKALGQGFDPLTKAALVAVAKTIG